MHDGAHGRAAVPNAFQTVSARPHDERRLLSARCAVTDRGQVVAHQLQGVVQVVQVLDFRDGPQPTHGHPNALPEDGALSDAGVADARGAELLLHAFHHLVDSPDAAGVLPEGQHPGVALEHHFKIALKHLTAVEHFRVGVVRGGHRLHVQGVVVAFAVEVGIVPLDVVFLKRRQPPREVGARR